MLWECSGMLWQCFGSALGNSNIGDLALGLFGCLLIFDVFGVSRDTQSNLSLPGTKPLFPDERTPCFQGSPFGLYWFGMFYLNTMPWINTFQSPTDSSRNPVESAEMDQNPVESTGMNRNLVESTGMNQNPVESTGMDPESSGIRRNRPRILGESAFNSLSKT